MQPPAQYNNSWSLGSGGNQHSTCSVAPALPALQQTVPYPTQPVVKATSECVLRNVAADPYFTKQGSLSAEELRWATICHLKGLPPSGTPAEWVTRTMVSISATTVDQVGPTPAVGVTSVPSASSAPAAAAAIPSPSSNDVLRHPDPHTSLEEIRWRDYQTAKQPGAAATAAAPAPAPSLPAAAAAGNVLQIPGLPQPQQQPAALAPGTSLPLSVPATPAFPTPVRTLFPPTPVTAGTAAFGGLGGLPATAGEDVMDTSLVPPDVEAHIVSMYARPENAVASPEEMRVVQIESYKLGRQIMPYWLVK